MLSVIKSRAPAALDTWRPASKDDDDDDGEDDYDAQ